MGLLVLMLVLWWLIARVWHVISQRNPITWLVQSQMPISWQDAGCQQRVKLRGRFHLGEVGVGSCALWRSLEERNIRRGSEETLFHPAVPSQGCVCHDLRSWSSLFLAGVNSSSLPLGMT